ncbi:MAG: radical SAM protein [Planctomycetes bacterium]|nr:radical SAM protein [Planctomycetota bacterium]
MENRFSRMLTAFRTKARTVSWRGLVSDYRIPYRILRGFYRALALHKNTLRTIDILPTFDCQARCAMCSVAKFRRSDAALLTSADYESIADQGARLGAASVVFLGGEPLVAHNICELVHIFDSRGFFCNVVSNGIALTADYAAELRAAGLDAIYFGLESLDEELNDRRRGYQGQCRKALEAARICKEQGLPVGICTVFVPGEMDRLLAVLRYCKENGLRVFLAMLVCVGAAEDMGGVTEDSYKQALSLLRQYPNVTVDWAFSYFLRPRCPAGKEKLAITCYGDVQGCSLTHISFGNVKQEPLRQIWRRAMRFSQFSKNADRCLAAFDDRYREEFMLPMARLDYGPVFYRDHPRISAATEPELFARG